jgi:ferredoxin
MMVYSIKINREKCIGCGSCEAICPESFFMKGGKAFVKKDSVEKINCEEEAVESCPVEAISIKKN